MSFRADLELDGTHRVLHASFQLQRSVDATGRPSSDVKGGTIHIEIESTSNNSFFEWMVSPYMMKSGSIKYFKRDDEAVMRELIFTDAYLISYTESIDAIGDNPMNMSMVFSAKTIEMGDGSLENDWPI